MPAGALSAHKSYSKEQPKQKPTKKLYPKFVADALRGDEAPLSLILSLRAARRRYVALGYTKIHFGTESCVWQDKYIYRGGQWKERFPTYWPPVSSGLQCIECVTKIQLDVFTDCPLSPVDMRQLECRGNPQRRPYEIADIVECAKQRLNLSYVMFLYISLTCVCHLNQL